MGASEDAAYWQERARDAEDAVQAMAEDIRMAHKEIVRLQDLANTTTGSVTYVSRYASEVLRIAAALEAIAKALSTKED